MPDWRFLNSGSGVGMRSILATHRRQTFAGPAGQLLSKHRAHALSAVGLAIAREVVAAGCIFRTWQASRLQAPRQSSRAQRA